MCGSHVCENCNLHANPPCKDRSESTYHECNGTGHTSEPNEENAEEHDVHEHVLVLSPEESSGALLDNTRDVYHVLYDVLRGHLALRVLGLQKIWMAIDLHTVHLHG
jgi:hypothetical protein